MAWHRTATWEEMKEKLKAKYLPLSHRQCMLDEWQRLTQGSKSIMEYISKFEEYLCRCEIQEDEIMILSHFRAGLHDDLRRELLIRDVHSLHDAYELVRNYDSLSNIPRHFTPNQRPNNFSKPNSGSPSSQRVNHYESDKGKQVFGSGRECFNCHQLGHHQKDCPKRALLIEEEQDDDEIDGEHVLDGECSEDEYNNQINILRESLVQHNPVNRWDNPSHVSVVRCTLSLPQQAEDWRRTAIL